MSKKISLAASTTIAIASTAPAYSLAVTIGILAASTGIHSAAVMIIALIPMMGIAWAFRMLSSKNPDSGTVFAWTTQAMGPKMGFIGGWFVCIASLVVMGSLAQVATLYLMKILGVEEVTTFWQAVIGIAWIALLTFICYKGIDITAKMQTFLVGAEVLILLVFAGVALFRVFTHSASPEAIIPDVQWLNPFGAGTDTFVGIAAALFIYWGWDTSLSIAEETKDSRNNPSKAAMLSIGITAGIYAIVVASIIAFSGIAAISGNEDDVFAVMAQDVLGSFGAFALMVAVLFSAISSTQTTILPTARTMFSMGRAGALPGRFGKQNSDTLTPEYSTLVTGAVSAFLYLILLVGGDNTIIDSVEATAVFICIYYILAAISAVIIFSKDSDRKFFKHIVIPGLAALVMVAVLIYTIVGLLPEKGTNAFFLGNALNIVVLCSIFGIIALGILSKRDFFKENTTISFTPEEEKEVNSIT